MSYPTNTIKTFVPDNEYEILRFQKDVGSEIILNIRKVLRDEDINFSGDLSNSFKLVMINGKAWIETDNKYALLVDRGLNPGTYVNFDAIKDWVKIKLGIGNEPELTEVTWKIVRKIRSTGIKPKRFAKKAIKMVIGEHGLSNVRRNSGGSNKKKSGKFFKRVKKIFKTINKVIKSINKNLNKTSKYQKKLGRYK